MFTCTANDVLVYLARVWPRTHQARGGGPVAPSTLEGAASALSTFFRQVGRGAPYDEQQGTGNPCTSVFVTGYLSGYPKQGAAEGRSPVGAVPMNEGTMRAVAVYLSRAIAEETGGSAKALVLMRDRAVLLLVWATAIRAGNCGELLLSDFREPGCLQREYDWATLPAPQLAQPYPQGVELWMWQKGDKTHKRGRAEPYYVPARAEGQLCAVRALGAYVAACRSSGWAAVRGYLFRPLQPDQRAFKEEPLAVTDRLERHLEAAMVNQGETMHSLRRGVLQAAAAQGANVLTLLEVGHMKSVGTLGRYLNPTSHMPRTEAWQLRAGQSRGERSGYVASEGATRGRAGRVWHWGGCWGVGGWVSAAMTRMGGERTTAISD